MTTGKGEGARVFLRPPMGNNSFYSREYLSMTRNSVMKAWTNPSNLLKREVALTLLADPELRLRICHLEEILRARQLVGRLQVNGFGAPPAGKDLPPVQLQTVLADPSFSSLFELDASVNDPEWGMQVLWLNMTQLQKELGLPPPPAPPSPSQSSVLSPGSSPTKPTLTSSTSDASSTASTAAGSGLTTPVFEPLLLAAVEAAFSGYPTDDGDYLAIAASFCLCTWRDPKGLLPAHTLHLTDLTAHLRACALADPRLAVVLKRAAAAPAAAAAVSPQARSNGAAAAAAAHPQNTLGSRLAELLAAPRARMVFRQNESLSRKGERVVSLAIEQLMRLTGETSAGGVAAAAGSRSATGKTPSGSNAALPYDVWRRAGGAGAAPFAGNATCANGGASGAETLPVFLFEYEAPTDKSVRDDMTAPAASQRDQYNLELRLADSDGIGVGNSEGRNHGAPNGSGCSLRTASSVGIQSLPPQFKQSNQQPNTYLHHAWSEGSTVIPEIAATAPLLPPSQRKQQQIFHCNNPSVLQSMASEPMPLRNGDVREFDASRLLAASSDGGAGDLYGFQGLGLGNGASWPSPDKAATEGASPTKNGLSSSRRYPLFNGGGGTDALLQQTIAAATGAAGPPVLMTTTAALAASPSSTAGELFVPQEIAEVWSNSAGGGSLSARRGSMTAAINTVGGGLSALPADGSIGGIFAMSPTQEGSYLERLASRGASQLSNPTMGRSATNVGGPTANMGLLGLGGLGFESCTSAGTASLMGNGGGTGGPLVVGSAPAVSLPAYFNGGAMLAAAGGGGLGLGGGGFGSGGGMGAVQLEYASWQSSSPELSSSVGGRSAPIDHAAAALDSWMVSYCARVNGGGGGSVGATANGSGRCTGSSVAAVAGAAGGGANAVAGAVTATGPDGRVVLTSRTATGPSPSVSEESEEAANMVGGLDLDPTALTLEAIIGFDPSAQLDSVGAARRATLAGAAVGSASSKGIIAAAAASKVDANAIPGTATTSGLATPPSSKSFNSISGNSSANATICSVGIGGAGVDAGSRHSSLDSCEVLTGGGTLGCSNATNASMLTSWSALAARGSGAVPPTAHHAASMQLAAVAAAVSGRVPASQLQHSMLPPHGSTAVATAAQGLTATMVAMGAAGAGGAGTLSMARQSSLSHGGGNGSAAANANAVLTASGLVGMGALAPATTGAGGVSRDIFGNKGMHVRLSPRVKDEICQLIRMVPGLKAEDFDDGVLHQLTLKKSEEEAVGALRTLAAENLSGIQHMAAYINHIIKNYHLTGSAQGAGSAGTGSASLPSATVRANSTPVSSKAILQKLPIRVYKRLEEVINKCTYMEWKHFDAGVVKVMAQLAEIGEDDVFEELELLKSTDLSNVEYMPAYLNKRLNNRLWSRRKLLTSAAAAAAVGAGGP